MTWATILLVCVTAERLAELWWARSNTRRLLQRGAVEHAAGHYPLIVALHALWLAGLWHFGRSQPISIPWLVVFLILQAGRVWVLATLGRRWTTRIIVLAGEPLIRTGPYRHVAHPNYLVVAGEIAVLPLCLHLPWYALVFSLANAWVLSIRLRAENAALSGSMHEATG
ncbi:MAG: isoprenylcysteine carboxylmethyltransferase family protein [Hyphomicrobiales bacterium]